MNSNRGGRIYEFPGDVPLAVNYNARSSLATLLSFSPRDRVPRIMRIKRRVFAYFERASDIEEGERERERRLIEDNSWMRSTTRRPRCSTFVCSGLFLRSPRFVNSGRPPFETAENDPVVYNGPHYLMAQTMIPPWKHLVSS